MGARGSGPSRGRSVAGVRRSIAERVSPTMVRYVGTAALLVLGVLSVLETLGILTD